MAVSRIDKVQRRRQALVEKAAAQREVIDIAATRALRGPLAVADKGVTLAAFLWRRPAILAAALTALVALRARGGRQVTQRTVHWARRGMQAWRGVQLARTLLAVARAAASP